MCAFDGRLSESQRRYLQEHGISEKKIKKIEFYLTRHKEGLTDYVDLVGDDLLPGSFFFFNLKYFGKLLDLDPERTFADQKNKIRAKVTIPIIQRLGKYFLSSKQIFEDRNELTAFARKKNELEKAGIFDIYPEVDPSDFTIDKGIEIPEDPAIWIMNHRFKDDVLASVLCIPRPLELFFGSMPQFFNTIDGVLAYCMGTIVINRKSKASKAAAQKKLKYAISDMRLDSMIAPEGVWNKNPHKLLEHFWPGVFRCARETNSKKIPIIHYIKDPTQSIPKHFNPIHTVIDDPIDISSMPEKEAIDCLRQKMASWYFIMMEKYGQTTRKELINGHKSSADAYEEVMQGIMKTVDRYDTEFEKTNTFHPKDETYPEDTFRPIASIIPTSDNLLLQQYAKDLVLTREKENFQRRF